MPQVSRLLSHRRRQQQPPPAFTIPIPIHNPTRAKLRWTLRQWSALSLALALALVSALICTNLGPLRNPRDGAPRTRSAPSECSIYLAPSAVSDAQGRPAGFGVFTVVPLGRGERVFPRGTGPTVAIPDVVARDNGGPSWASLIFMPPCAGFDIESARRDPSSRDCLKSNGNIGSLTNFHPMLLNVMMDDADVYVDNLLDRRQDPGAGAFSYHMDEKWFVTRDVDAGEELFNDYSERWFLDGEMGSEGRHIPHRADYLEAAGILDELARRAGDGAEGPDVAALLRQMKDTDVDENVIKLLRPLLSDAQNFVATIGSAAERAACVDKPTYVFSYDDHPGSETKMQLALELGRRTLLPRTVDWIRQHGRCLDHIYPAPSTLPQAGQGAFARRPLRKGEVVAPVPTMVQVTDRRTLNMYRREKYKDGKGRPKMRPTGDAPHQKQLLVNYCFGHERSSVLLCPSTNANLINHCGCREGSVKQGRCDPSVGPNAKLRWTKGFDPETSEWLTLSVEEIDRRVVEGRRGLSFEIVATRDIAADGEIFVDYGTAWEDAWARHAEAWTPPSDDGFVPVSDMNADVDAHLRTEAELQLEGYPQDVRVGCRFEGFYHPCKVLRREGRTGADPDDTGRALPSPEMYVVRLSRWTNRKGTHEFGYEWYGEGDSVEARITGGDVQFFTGPHSSDQHMPGAFRHSIGVPDGMWPSQWMNM